MHEKTANTINLHENRWSKKAMHVNKNPNINPRIWRQGFFLKVSKHKKKKVEVGFIGF
jgi:hypothetical protein